MYAEWAALLTCQRRADLVCSQEYYRWGRSISSLAPIDWFWRRFLNQNTVHAYNCSSCKFMTIITGNRMTKACKKYFCLSHTKTCLQGILSLVCESWKNSVIIIQHDHFDRQKEHVSLTGQMAETCWFAMCTSGSSSQSPGLIASHTSTFSSIVPSEGSPLKESSRLALVLANGCTFLETPYTLKTLVCICS